MSDGSNRGAALVLASTRGLGYAAAEELVSKGWPVAICGRNAEAVTEAEKRLTRLGAACGYVCDVMDRTQLENTVSRVRKDMGDIEVLVTNSGGPPIGGFDEVTLDDWDTAYQLIISSFVNAVRAVLPAMRSRQFGRIVVIGSSSIRRPIQNLVLSNTFRPALNGLVKDLATTLAAEGITVNMVAPGRIDTERIREIDYGLAQRLGSSLAHVQEASAATIPARRYGEPRELAAVIGFLASHAAGYVTGQSVLVDGGMVASLP